MVTLTTADTAAAAIPHQQVEAGHVGTDATACEGLPLKRRASDRRSSLRRFERSVRVADTRSVFVASDRSRSRPIAGSALVLDGPELAEHVRLSHCPRSM